jgi:hypothetical protein
MFSFSLELFMVIYRDKEVVQCGLVLISLRSVDWRRRGLR